MQDFGPIQPGLQLEGVAYPSGANNYLPHQSGAVLNTAESLQQTGGLFQQQLPNPPSAEFAPLDILQQQIVEWGGASNTAQQANAVVGEDDAAVAAYKQWSNNYETQLVSSAPLAITIMMMCMCSWVLVL